MWAGIWKEGRTALIVIKRDQSRPRKSYTAWSYREALREGLLPHYDGTKQFMQDNAAVHSAAETIEWLMLHGIEYIDWPPYSPDLNPIEHVWRVLKAKIRSLYPQLPSLMDNEADRAVFIDCVTTAWRAINQDQIRGLLISLPRRLRAVIRAHGWYTRY